MPGLVTEATPWPRVASGAEPARNLAATRHSRRRRWWGRVAREALQPRAQPRQLRRLPRRRRRHVRPRVHLEQPRSAAGVEHEIVPHQLESIDIVCRSARCSGGGRCRRCRLHHRLDPRAHALPSARRQLQLQGMHARSLARRGQPGRQRRHRPRRAIVVANEPRAAQAFAQRRVDADAAARIRQGARVRRGCSGGSNCGGPVQVGRGAKAQQHVIEERGRKRAVVPPTHEHVHAEVPRVPVDQQRWSDAPLQQHRALGHRCALTTAERRDRAVGLHLGEPRVRWAVTQPIARLRDRRRTDALRYKLPAERLGRLRQALLVREHAKPRHAGACGTALAEAGRHAWREWGSRWSHAFWS